MQHFEFSYKVSTYLVRKCSRQLCKKMVWLNSSSLRLHFCFTLFQSAGSMYQFCPINEAISCFELLITGNLTVLNLPEQSLIGFQIYPTDYILLYLKPVYKLFAGL